MRCLRATGQGMVEYAIVLPVFVWLTVGVIDFGRAIWEYNTVAFLARDGAHWGTIPTHGTTGPNNIPDYVTGRCHAMLSQTCNTYATLPAHLTPDTAGIRVTRGICGDTSSPVIVAVAYEFQPASAMIADLISGDPHTLRLYASSQMYVEAAPAGGCAA